LTVLGNEDQLRHAVKNLVDNALKYTPDHGEIVCSCHVQVGGADLGMRWVGGSHLPAGRWAALTVRDSGIGISEHELPKLFQRFYRVKSQGSIPGTGLGLSIARELVELHDGHIALSSVPGKGSAFAIFLPLVEE
jgi:signal transduction histidine kinase